MKYGLIIDTTSDVLTLILTSKNKIINFFKGIDGAKKHTSQLLVQIENLLESNDLTLQDIDIFGVATGPGSFTGIRIGVSAINAFATALSKPIVAMTSLEIFKSRNSLILLDCKHNNFYGLNIDDYGNFEYLNVTKEEVDSFSKSKFYIENVDVEKTANLFFEKVIAKDFVETAKPFYLKKSSAEIEYEKSKS